MTGDSHVTKTGNNPAKEDLVVVFYQLRNGLRYLRVSPAKNENFNAVLSRFKRYATVSRLLVTRILEQGVRRGNSSSFKDKRDASIFNQTISPGRVRLIKERKKIIDTFSCSEEAFVCGLTPRMPFDAYWVF